jgi:hypothetical protein
LAELDGLLEMIVWELECVFKGLKILFLVSEQQMIERELARPWVKE